MKAVQKKEARGSLKWIRIAVNDCAPLLNRKIQEACGIKTGASIQWVSPLVDDEYAEYGDEAFLKRLGITPTSSPLIKFWPDRGPQWDALGRTNGGGYLIVEAKANLREVVSPATQAAGQSKKKIQRSLRKVQEFLDVDRSISWTGKLYQYTNRVAHLYFLRKLNKINAHLVFVYFIGDKDVKGPNSVAEWKAALTVAKGVLGLGERHRLSKYIGEVFIDINELK